MRNETFRTWWRLFAQRWDRADQPELAAFYWSELQGMDDATFERSARHALRSSTFFPTVAELESAGGVGSDPARQWEKVLPLLRNFSTPLDSLDEPAQRAVRAMGGLSRIGSDVDGIPFRRAEFMELYASYANGTERDRLPPMTDAGQKLIRDAMASPASVTG